ncbi:MAG: hypothetical protein ACUZ9M_00685 [Candidatus Scalindua sp.]
MKAIILSVLASSIIMYCLIYTTSSSPSSQANYDPDSSSSFRTGCSWHSYLIPTKMELQQILVDEGYDIGSKGVDGEIGEDTLSGWEKATGNQFAVEFFNPKVYK